MEKKLAIIIPAYKARFLRETLDSILKQNSSEFIVYVGDDASPENIEGLVHDYDEKLDIVYHRFSTNLGGVDLPGQWDRCIALSNEPLVWLFSDDDIMPFDGVKRVMQAVGKYGDKLECMRFPLMVIDACGNMKYQNPPFETERISGYEFLLDKLSGKISSAACEYVFSRDVWKQIKGFVKFPFAWCSDDATWASFADLTEGIISLPGRAVCWRNVEGENISNSVGFDKEKLRATGLFFNWINRHYPCNLRDARLRKALEAYTHTILSCSVRGNFSLCDLVRLCYALGKIDYVAALHVAYRHLLKK